MLRVQPPILLLLVAAVYVDAANLPDRSAVAPQIPRCGHRNQDGVGFRIQSQDNETNFGEFPWTVAVLRQEQIDGVTLKMFQCGGSLLHPNVVLTAAHCVHNKDPNTLLIRAGEWDTQTMDELFPHQDRRVAEVVIHEEFNRATLYNDIALLYLTEPIALMDNVNTICLPPPNHTFDHSRCVATGWGKDVWGKLGKYQLIMKKVELAIVPRPECVDALHTTRLGRHFQLHKSFICAGGEPGVDTCRGDGGSPLVCPIAERDHQYHQTGIVAFGIGCGAPIPGVYVDVSHFRTWIDLQFDDKHIDKLYYTA